MNGVKTERYERLKQVDTEAEEGHAGTRGRIAEGTMGRDDARLEEASQVRRRASELQISTVKDHLGRGED